MSSQFKPKRADGVCIHGVVGRDMKGDRKCRGCLYAVYRRWLPITSECAFGGVITNSKDELFDFKPEWCEYDISSRLRRTKRRIYAEWYNLVYKVENWCKSRREKRTGNG